MTKFETWDSTPDPQTILRQDISHPPNIILAVTYMSCTGQKQDFFGISTAEVKVIQFLFLLLARTHARTHCLFLLKARFIGAVLETVSISLSSFSLSFSVVHCPPFVFELGLALSEVQLMC